MHIFGLTGGIASGKSTVASTLRELGATVIDADAVYHDLIAPQDGQASPLVREIAKEFDGVVAADGNLDRKRLGGLVFGNKEALARLGKITHPAVAMEFARRVQAYAEQGVDALVYDVPLLYERGLDAGMHAVMVVWVPREIQLKRLMARDGIDREAAEKRLASQMSLDEKRDRTEHAIDNSGSREQTAQRVRQLWQQLRSGSD